MIELNSIKLKRKFLPENLEIKDWKSIKSFYEELKNRSINSKEDLYTWLEDRDELESVVSEDLAWRYIRMNCNTADEKASKSFELFINEIQQEIIPQTNILNKKFIESKFVSELLYLEGLPVYCKTIQRNIELYHEKNIPIITEINNLQQEYGKITSSMSVNINGEEMTLQKAAKLLEDSNRAIRKEAYEKITKRRLQNKSELNELLNKLIALRNSMAINSGYQNFRDYMHDELCRFDFSVQDCLYFHESVSKSMKAVLNNFVEEKKKNLKLEEIFPFDLDAETVGEQPLKPFTNSDEMVERTINVFNNLNPFFAECISVMNKNHFLDLDSRKNKAPGGFNYPLMESGIPFIYMNSVNSHKDMVTMVHEGGHAIHSFLCNALKFSFLKSTPSEVAELASMGMEMLSMEFWNEFYPNHEDLKKAKKDQLEKALETLAWVAAIDKFQHWLYTSSNHTIEERENKWKEIFSEFSSDWVSYNGYEDALKNMWQKQLHIYEVPFYYIEYGFAQLGALALWKNYKENPNATVSNYINALKLGYTKSVPEIYKTAGIEFNFSKEYINSIIEFIQIELKKLV